ncbi:unnamed protein product, partial [Allacma fusca]
MQSNGYNVFPVAFWTPIIKIVTYILALYLLHFSRAKGIQSSGVQFLFWLLLTVCETITFRTVIRIGDSATPEGSLPFVIHVIYYPLIVGQLLINCWADLPPEYEQNPRNLKEKPCPEKGSSYLNRILFSWYDTLAWRGWRRPLEHTDLWALNPEDTSRAIVPKFDACFKRGLEKTKKKGNSNNNEKQITSILPALFGAFGGMFYFGAALKIFPDVMAFASPQILNALIDFINTAKRESTAGETRKLQVDNLKNKDERVKMMNEILSGVKVLKLYAWEPSFQDQVMKAFVSLSLFNLMNVPIAFFPMIIVYMVQAMVSLQRLNKYMNGEEIDPESVTHDPTAKHPIIIEDGSFAWEPETTVLKNVNLNVHDGELLAVVGTVGSGKSSLLASMLGELEKKNGRVNTIGTIAYVPQQAWIQNVTLRDNILFGRPFEPPKYEKVIEACALKPDLEILPGGDQTEIGEKGINLSGGQKQRVSLARATYNNSEVYLFDDPLSAVDSHDGEISEYGTYQELLDKKGAFSEFLMHHIATADEEDLDDLELLKELE